MAARRIASSSAAPRRRPMARSVPPRLEYGTDRTLMSQEGAAMRAKGIGYDTGFSFDGVHRRPFDHHVVRRELEIIRDDLHCSAVRLFGNDLDRLDFAARYAADLGLEVWYSPFTYQLDPDEMLAFLADAAERAERIRPYELAHTREVVFVTGAEVSLFNRGFLPGDSLDERTALLFSRPPNLRELVLEASTRVNEFLAKAVGVV